MIPLYPFLLEPSLQPRVWGGRQLETVLHKHLPTDEPYGEAWEVHDTATVANGPLAGRTLGHLLNAYGPYLIGPDKVPAKVFPLWVKFIDLADWSSVQVHPASQNAQGLDGCPLGKTEVYYILSAQPGAQLIVGFGQGTSAEELNQAIVDGTLVDLLIRATVTRGDAVFVPAGTIHAVGPGILLYEIQQACDTTYRLYDWGRAAPDGHSRQLHVEKGLAVADLALRSQIRHTADNASDSVEVVRSEYFTTVLHRLNEGNSSHFGLLTERRCFQVLTCLGGHVRVLGAGVRVDLTIGRSVLIPADLGRYELAGTGIVLRSFQGRNV